GPATCRAVSDREGPAHEEPELDSPVFRLIARLDDHLGLANIEEPYLAAMRRAPSSRITEPFSIEFSIICRANCANSAGRPRRAGNGTDCPSDTRAGSGN